MDRRERLEDRHESLQATLDGRQMQIWTAMPGIVQTFDPDKITVNVKISIKGKQRKANGDIVDIEMPELRTVPVVPQRGGHCTLTFPIKPGDECLVVFSNRCMDGWWQNGGIQAQVEWRMHDLSDGFAIIGPFSQMTKIKEWSTERAELRSDDHEAVVTVHPTTHDITAETTSNVHVTALADITMNAGGKIDIFAKEDVTIKGAHIRHYKSS